MGSIIDDAWRVLFEKHNIVDVIKRDKIFYISSKEINEVKEARLMAKFDQSSLLPEIFVKNRLSILPVTRGEYAIAPFETHANVTYGDIKPTFVDDPKLETLKFTDLYSESSALLFAYNSGIISKFLDTKPLKFTVNGRMSSGVFDYSIKGKDRDKYKVAVKNAQIEIDAGYENSDIFCLCEGKNIKAEQILIRQLFYPYRLWRQKISKPVIPIFVVYSNDVFYLFQYAFEDDNYYNSLKLVKQGAYTLKDESIKFVELVDLWSTTNPIFEPNITFPQADSFGRVVDLLSILFKKSLTRDEITLEYEFSDRQTNYYISACDYLGLVDRKKGSNGERIYSLNDLAKSIMRMSHKKKYMMLFKQILELPVFWKAFQFIVKSGVLPSKNKVCETMKNSNLNISDATIERRSSTVLGWLDWMMKQVVL